MITMRDRYRGCLVGLAVGDAVGTTVEFESPGTFLPVTDMAGGGPFGLEPGQWTDDTSMALAWPRAWLPVRSSTRWTKWTATSGGPPRGTLAATAGVSTSVSPYRMPSCITRTPATQLRGPQTSTPPATVA